MVDMQNLRKNAILEAKKKIAESVKKDLLIIQTVHSIDELEKVINSLIEALREWCGYYCPEISMKIKDHEKFVNLIFENDLFKKFDIRETMGGNLEENDVNAILTLANSIKELYKTKKLEELYLAKEMNNLCSNLIKIAGPEIGARLIKAAGSLKKLARMPSSTIQLLGAEKALFRHLKIGSKSPKYGLIFYHTDIQKSKNKGKSARQLASKITIGVRIDYFKNEKNN